ncbi:MAG: GtrA family protein [Gammaproteobacteria bacterium]|nr:MAG: GtrA family protein [Gammaproteobacteria bacterium]
MKRFALFIGIGGISTLIQFLLLILFVEFNLLPEVVASAAGYVLASFFSYWANYHFTFASKQSHWKAYPKFALTVGLGMSVNTVVFAGLFFIFGQLWQPPWIEPYLAAQVLATGFTLVVNFLMHKFWIYKEH